MLEKGFFNVKPFNPNPYFDPVIVNLSGAQKFEEDTIFLPGKYNIVVQAGSSITQSPYETIPSVFSGKISTTIDIMEKFIVRAYCGSKANSGTSAGTNTYSGGYKVNGNVSYGSDVPAVAHIFGNAGSCCRVRAGSTEYYPSSGNCLGNGATWQTSSYSSATGAGSCLHLLPIGGTFGSDYLFAFHTTAAGGGFLSGGLSTFGGSGSAYGGAGSGTSNNFTYSSVSYAGGSTPYGQGGAGSSGAASGYTKNGNNGTGIGHGFGGGIYAKGCYTPGSAAYFDGSQWVESNLVTGANEDGKIIVTYLGPLV